MLNKYVLFVIMVILSLFGLTLPKLKELLNYEPKNIDLGIIAFHVFIIAVSLSLIIKTLFN